MNIFYLSKSPIKCAESMVDKHVVKMILESAQLLCAAHRILSPDDLDNQYRYKLTHKNHPCAIWVRQSKQNYDWLFKHFMALLNEYNRRYKKVHSCSRLIPYLKNAPKEIPNVRFTDPPKAMPDEYKTDSTIKSYQNYYKLGKKHLHV